MIASIMKKIGKLDNYKDLNKMPILRRNNRIHSIHSSLDIEENSLSFKSPAKIVGIFLLLISKCKAFASFILCFKESE